MLNDFLWTKRKNILKVSYLKYNGENYYNLYQIVHHENGQ